MKQLFTSFLLFTAFIAASFAQTNQVIISFEHKAGAAEMDLAHTVFPIWNNKMVNLTRAEFYISEVSIQNPGGVMMPLNDQYLLVNANAPTTEFDLGTWPVESVQGVTLHLGVPEVVNHEDPTTWPENHPLAPQNPSMHWGWSAGYRFMAIEGKVDNNGDGVPESTFEFHNLGDALYKSIQLTGITAAENGVLHLHFVLDYAQLFKNIAMAGNLIHHGSATMNTAMMNNGATQGFVTMATVTASQEVEINSLNIKASPNPANVETNLQYTLPASAAIDLMLTNTLGQTVSTYTGLPASGTLPLHTAALPEGIYQYAFYENGNLLARKQLVIKH
jgi:hypothetical protein